MNEAETKRRAGVRKYSDDVYLRSEDFLTGNVYQKVTWTVSEVVTDCPLMRRKKTYAGLGLAFEGQTKVLGLGLTNEGLVKAITGDRDYTKWIGAKLNLEVRLVSGVSGGSEPAIRVMPPSDKMIRSGLTRQLGKPFPEAAQ